MERLSISEHVKRARVAQKELATFDQARIDDIVCAVARVGYVNAEPLAKMAAEETGLGRYEDKVQKNRRKTLGTLRDLTGAQSMGVIHRDDDKGITEIAKPAGVVGAITPVTNPSATPINNIMITLKGANAVLIAPHPKADRTCAELIRLVHHELERLGAPKDAVQHVSLRSEDKEASKARSQELMREVDIVLVTAGPANVLAGYRSGTPALGVGRGNVPVIIDKTADIDGACDRIMVSATFDNATSCSSENALLLEDNIYDEVVAALTERGGYLATETEKASLQTALWTQGRLNRDGVAQPAAKVLELAGIHLEAPEGARLIMVEEEGVGEEFPFSGEKIAPVVALYKWHGFDQALDLVERILDYQGKGHSCGIHTTDEEHIDQLAARVDVCRMLVNQAHCIGNGGDFENGLDFTLSLAAGTWGGNSVPDNITYRHFLNVTRVARRIPKQEPTEQDLWGDYLRRYPDDPAVQSS